MDGCVEGKLLNPSEKLDLREEAKAALVYVWGWCGAAGRPRGTPILLANTSFALCRAAVELYLEIATQLVHDPPDPRFTVPPGSATPPALARSSAVPCPSNLSRSQCAALRTASGRYLGALNLLNGVAADIATGANRTASAVAANALLPAFFQEAFAKINEGAMAQDAAVLQSYGTTFARTLHADHLDVAISPSQAKSWLSKHPPSGLSKAQLKLIIGQLSSLSRGKLSAALGSSIPAPTSRPHTGRCR